MWRKIRIISLLLIIRGIVPAFGIGGNDTSVTAKLPVDLPSLRATADSLMKRYRFGEAAALLREAKDHADSAATVQIEEGMIQAQNGENMMNYCGTPVAVARERFSIRDFFLYYPLEEHSWRKTPNQLDSTGGMFAAAVNVPDTAGEIFWSAEDRDGIRNIYHSSRGDSLWTAPELLNEQMTSSFDEIYPMLSPDGKQLFFASRGLYGMGGFDLYVSKWDDGQKDWGKPENMGFPYSSPYDDFLYINTEDGKYSMFASNRGCRADSVDIYVLEFDSMPVRRAVTDYRELETLCRLDPIEDPSRMDNGSAVAGNVQDNSEMRRYSEKMQRVRSLRDSIYRFNLSIDADRGRLAEVSGAEKSQLAALIISKEAAIPVLQDSLAVATRALQQIEMQFLQSGVVIDPEKLQHDADREIVGVSSGYTFSKKDFGEDLDLPMEKPKSSFDYTFCVLPEGRFAEDNTLPGGIIYQIQLFSIVGKATVRQIKGLSPVFERPGAGGKRIYSAGVFHSYKDVLSNLNRVKRAGFRSAFIVAFKDGQPISVTKARTLEKTTRELYQIRIFPAEGNSLSEAERTAIAAITSADMARISEDGVISFLLGPFEDKAEAETVLSALQSAGISDSRLESAEELGDR